METESEKVPVWRFADGGSSRVEDVVAREFPLTIILNDTELVTLLCSPADLKPLAVGFLESEGLISSRVDLKHVLVDDVRGVVRVETSGDAGRADGVFRRFISSGCGRGASFYSAADVVGMPAVESSFHLSAPEVASLMREFQHRSAVYQATGGVHSAALCDSRSILVFAEDVGRHNALDKIFGHCLLEGIPTRDRVVVTSGRMSSEMLLKVFRRAIPVVASKSAPTNLGVKLANELGITLIGFARGTRMNVYSNEGRIG